MCGSLGCSLRSLTAFVPTWCTRNTSTGRGSSLTKRVFLLCWFCFMPSRRVDFVRHSFVVSHTPLVSAHVLDVQLSCWSSPTPWQASARLHRFAFAPMALGQRCSRLRFRLSLFAGWDSQLRTVGAGYYPRLTRPVVGLADQSSAWPTSRRLGRPALGYWISSSIPNRKRFDHLSVFAPISAHIHRVQPLLTGYSRNGRFISNQRGNINTVTMPLLWQYVP